LPVQKTGHQALQPLIDIQIKLKETNGVPKRPFVIPEKDEELVKTVEQDAYPRLYEAVQVPEKTNRTVAIRSVKSDILEKLGDDFADRKGEILDVFDDIYKKISRDIILKELPVKSAYYPELTVVRSLPGVKHRFSVY